MSIYVITHKEFTDFAQEPDYKVLLVGANKNQGKDSYLKDNSFEDNISDKNPSYCELTGAYWIWKHVQDEIVGLTHYRRYFTKEDGQVPSLAEVSQYLETHDIILPKKEKLINYFKFPCTMERQFELVHGREGVEAWGICCNVLKQQYPEFYTTFLKLKQNRSAYFYNMCILKKADFDAYCEWLFDILFRVEEKINVSNYTKYNQRMLGFLSERLLNLWVAHCQLNIKEMTVHFSESIPFFDMIKQEIHRKIEK